jgi:hypothetical protein
MMLDCRVMATVSHACWLLQKPGRIQGQVVAIAVL